MEASKNDRLVKKFAALEDKTWFPQELLELVKDVCRLQSEVRASLAVSVDPALVCGDMEHRQGAPLLAREQFPVDAEGAEKLFRAILEVAESLPQLRTTAQLVRDKLIRGDIRPEELFRAYMLENADPFEAWAKEAPDAPNLLPFLVYNSMEPWLEAAGEALSSAYPQNDVWQHGHCPVCGSPAFIGHLSGPEPSRNEGRDINKGGKRMHTCSYCRTTFRAKRIQCPFCLGARNWTIWTENEPVTKLWLCRSCKIHQDSRLPRILRPSIPALDDLESLPLDIAAQNEDFHRVAPSEWGL
ncbi:MAG: formate dehydrogenase accessory protein FdhE [Bilophila wadsworthia]